MAKSKMREARDKREKLIVGCGRDMAQAWMANAIETAKSNEMMNNQIDILRRASIHVLATEMYNDAEQMDISPNDYLKRLNADILLEFEYLRKDGDLIKAHAGDKLTTPNEQ